MKLFLDSLGPAEEFLARVDVEVDSPGPSTVIKSISLRARAGTAKIHIPKHLQVCVTNLYLQPVFQEWFASPSPLQANLECLVLLCIYTKIHLLNFYRKYICLLVWVLQSSSSCHWEMLETLVYI